MFFLNRPLTEEDYIHSMLLDSQEMYIVAPNQRKAYMFLPGRGMVIVNRDFSQMTNEQVGDFLFQLRRGL